MTNFKLYGKYRDNRSICRMILDSMSNNSYLKGRYFYDHLLNGNIDEAIEDVKNGCTVYLSKDRIIQLIESEKWDSISFLMAQVPSFIKIGYNYKYPIAESISNAYLFFENMAFDDKHSRNCADSMHEIYRHYRGQNDPEYMGNLINK